MAYNCLDRHVTGPRKTKAALIWEGEPGDSRVLTYWDLYREVNRFAAALKRHGVKKGDRVTIYMPMVPELPIAMLACARIGAAHSVIFGGFSPEAVRERIHDAESTLVITADGGYRRGGTVALKKNTDEALARRARREDRDRAQAHGPARRDEERPRHLVGRLRQGRAGALPRRADGLRGSAVPALHLRVDRQAEGDRAHDRRLPDRRQHDAQVDLRPPGRRRLLVHRRHRLGDRALLHRLRAAGERRHHGHVRGDARLSRQGPVLADRREVRRHDLLHGADRDPHVHEVGRGVSRSAATSRACDCSARSASRSTPRPGSGTGR